MNFLDFFKTRKRLTVYAIAFLVVLSVFIVSHLSKNRAIHFSKNRTVFYNCENRTMTAQIGLTGDIITLENKPYICKKHSHILQCVGPQEDRGMDPVLIFDKKNLSLRGVLIFDRDLLSKKNKTFTNKDICFIKGYSYDRKYDGCLMFVATCQ